MGDAEREFCEAFRDWQERCIGDNGLELNCDGPMCVPEWKDWFGDDCQYHQERNYCTEEGEYDIGWVADEGFSEGTNGLDAFDACPECGACSVGEFLDSDAYADLQKSNIFAIITGPVLFVVMSMCYICYWCKSRKGDEETPAVAAPVQQQQPATNIVIQSGFQPAPNQYKPQPQYQPAPYAAPAPYAPPAPYPQQPPQNNWGPVAGQ